MLVIEMGFPGGRYHATPWDKHVNEGAVEWPPSPWRFLRALIATWYTKGEGVDFDSLRAIVHKLAPLPEFYLPQVTTSSTCHFMPLYRSPLDDKTANVYDAFAHVGEGKLRFIWRDVTLDDRDKEALNILLSRMGYLGRAESWIDAIIADVDDSEVNCRPSATASGNGERVATMCCLSPEDYDSWRESTIAALVKQKADEKKAKALKAGKEAKGLSAKDRKNIEANVPPTLFDALQVDTAEMRAAGWPRPPGSRWVSYELPGSSLSTAHAARVKESKRPTVARYKIRSKVPWTIFDAVALGDLIHTRLVWLSDGSSTFTGCDDERQPLKGDHAMILSHGIASQIGGMRITDITVFNKDGFSARDEAALRSLRDLDEYGRKGKKEIDNEVILIGIGNAETFSSERGVIARSDKWVSITPFVPTRCPKYTRAGEPKLDENGRHIGSAEHELRRLLEAEGYPEVKRITPIPRATVGGSSRSWLSFKRRRSSEHRKPLNDAGFGFEIEFAEPVEGPLALGYGRNYGLGLFRPG
jgi:CRISPR-associated protein Csb2